MYKYFTKDFGFSQDIDFWLNSFTDGSKSTAERNMEVVGYVVLDNRIIITVKQFNS